jgi:hypothetical protein
MPKYVTESGNVICIDGEYIDTEEIAKVSKAEEIIMEFLSGSETGEKSKHWSFDIMFKGHSNVMHISGENELEAELKRKFIVEAWAMVSIENIEEFDYDKAFLEFQEEMEGYEGAEEDEDEEGGEELN